MKNKHNTHYGTFIVKKQIWQDRTKVAKVGAISVILLVSVVAFAIALFNYDKPQQQNFLSIQEAQASDDLPGWWYDEYFGSSVCDLEWCKAGFDADNDKLT